MRCFYQLSEKPPDPDPAHRFWVLCKGSPYGKIPVLAIAWLKFSKCRGKNNLDKDTYSRITFKGWNCRHDWYPYFGGTRMYDEEKLKQMDAKNIEYPDGSMHTL